MQPLAFKSTFPAILLFAFKEIKVTLICRINNASEKRAHTVRTCASQNPRDLNRTCDKLVLAHLQAVHLAFFLHHFAPPSVRWSQSACFPIESSSACYHKCPCVLTISAGVCSGKELNDQQATVATTVQRDAYPETVDLLNHESTVPRGGGTAGWRDRGEEVPWC